MTEFIIILLISSDININIRRSLYRYIFIVFLDLIIYSILEALVVSIWTIVRIYMNDDRSDFRIDLNCISYISKE